MYDIKLILNIPDRGRIVIEGGANLVADLFDDVKSEFISQVSESIRKMKGLQVEDANILKLEKKGDQKPPEGR